MIIREINREFNIDKLSNFDASFSTDCIYRVSVKEMSVKIAAEKLDVSFEKSYSFASIKNDIDEADFAVAAEIDKIIAGFAAVKYEAWNNRAVLTGIFVAPEYRGKNVGRALIDAATAYAKIKSARCLFAETQNVNYPAIRFYLKTGFEFCGFDAALYNPAEVSSFETAIYFRKNL